MIKYKIYKSKDEISVFGHEQCFDEEEIADLWDKHKILFIRGGIVAVWVEERDSMNPLVHLIGEDDGQIFWMKEKDICFDSYWIDNYIDILSRLKEQLGK